MGEQCLLAVIESVTVPYMPIETAGFLGFTVDIVFQCIDSPEDDGPPLDADIGPCPPARWLTRAQHVRSIAPRSLPDHRRQSGRRLSWSPCRYFPSNYQFNSN